MTDVVLPPDTRLAAEVVRALESAGIEDVVAVYLFGSAAREQTRRDSDVDLAFLTRASEDVVSVFDAAQSLAERLGRSVDLVDLKRTSSVMRLQILSRGRRILATDVVAADTFEMYAYSDYARLQEERAVTIRAFESAYDE